MSVWLWWKLLSVVFCWSLSNCSNGLPIVTSPPLTPGSRSSQYHFAEQPFLETAEKKIDEDNLTRKDEPEELNAMGIRRRNIQNRVLENILLASKRRKASFDIDNPIFESKGAQKVNDLSHNSQITNFRSKSKGRFDAFSDRINNNKNNSRPVVLQSDLKNNILDRFEDATSSTPLSSEVDQKITLNIVALGESRSYSSVQSKENSPGRIVSSDFTQTASTEINTSTEENSITTVEDEKTPDFSWTADTSWSSIPEPEKIISVKVSSSAASQPQPSESKYSQFTTTHSLTLLTEEPVKVTAVQRSQLNVEEPPPKASNTDESDTQIPSVSYSSSGSVYVQQKTKPDVEEDKTSKEKKETLDNDPVASSNNTVDMVNEETQTSASYLPQEERNETSVTVLGPRSYQFTNIRDHSYHHVHVTHYSSPDPPKKTETETQKNYGMPEKIYGLPEKNYEVDESVSLMSNGRVHGVQPTKDKNDSNKFGYVVEGRDFRKYRVEERTSDGFIVGEYGVVRHDDGSLRGVRYTADGTTNPRLIYDALVKFLTL